MIISPRQAREKHRENSTKGRISAEREILRHLCTPPERACPLIINCLGTAQVRNVTQSSVAVSLLESMFSTRVEKACGLFARHRSGRGLCLLCVRALPRCGKRLSFEPLLCKKRSIYQDRLGTNIQEKLRKERFWFCFVSGGDFCSVLKKKRRLPVATVLRKTASFFECFPYVCPEPVLAK
eukprot:COSAG06_NODE_1163_length_10454_cov_16.507677_5_plen_181_part_00